MVEILPGVFLATTLELSIPIVIAAMGELITERSGVLNIGIEGVMLSTSFVAAYVHWALSSLPAEYGIYIAIVGAAIVGMVINSVLVVMSTYLHADQVIAGIGINVFASGFTILALFVSFGVFDVTPTVVTSYSLSPLVRIPNFGPVSPFLLIMAVAPIFAYWLLYRTRFGLRVRAVGENPEAAEVAGLNVYKLRILATALGGLFIGLAGAYLSVDFSPFFVRFNTRGLGFIALAAVIAGGWSPLAVVLSGLLFGGTYAVFVQFGGISGQFLAVLPYIATVVAMSLASKRLRPPAALARPYVRE